SQNTEQDALADTQSSLRGMRTARPEFAGKKQPLIDISQRLGGLPHQMTLLAELFERDQHIHLIVGCARVRERSEMVFHSFLALADVEVGRPQIADDHRYYVRWEVFCERHRLFEVAARVPVIAE